MLYPSRVDLSSRPSPGRNQTIARWRLIVFKKLLITLIVVSLTACATGPTTGPEPAPKPEPPIMVISLPVTLNEVLARCEPVQVASLSAVPPALPQDCANLFTHGLRPERLAEFAALGIDVTLIFQAINSGDFSMINAGLDANGRDSGFDMMVKGVRVLLIFGQTTKPTIYPLPKIKIGETMAEAMVRLFTGANAKFPTKIEMTAEITAGIKSLAGCVSGLIKEHMTSGNKLPKAQDENVSAPTGTPTVEAPSEMVIAPSGAFATTDSNLARLAPEEIELLIFLGVVVVIGVVVISCATTACIGAVPGTTTALVTLVAFAH